MSSTQTIEFICYPFGMVMPGRNWTAASAEGYRFGFNGKEGDNEIKGENNSLDFGGRNIYDSRLGRFISVDPNARKFIFLSPYCFAGNNPIRHIDTEGLGPGDPPNDPQKTNLMIIISSDVTLNTVFYNSADQVMGSWYIIVANDVEVALTKAQNYLGTSKVDNLYLGMHGITYGSLDAQGNFVADPTDRALDTSPTETGSAHTIDEFEVNSYLAGLSTTAEGSDASDYTAGEKRDIDALKGLSKLVNDNGTLLIGSCNTADDLNLINAIISLTGNRLNVYANHDYTLITADKGVAQIWEGEYPRSSTSPDENVNTRSVGKGWIKFSTDTGLLEDLKGKEGKTGGIYLDSREGKQPVNEIKKN